MNALDKVALSDFLAPPHILPYLQDAARFYQDAQASEEKLLQAIKTDPDCLAAYFSLYKFYFYKRRLHDAEKAALAGLDAAARCGNFMADWAQLKSDSTDWTKIPSPQHFYLFTLKALTFIQLRLGREVVANTILVKLMEIDPGDSVRADVIRQLQRGSTER